jgi:hypothetical protein
MAPLIIVWRKGSSSAVLRSFLEMVESEKPLNKLP